MRKLDLKFEIKAMGIGFFIPIIIIIGTIIHSIYLMSALGIKDISIIITKLEFFIVPAIGIWIIYLFYEYYENENLEVLLSYPISGYEHVFIKVIAFIGLYIICLIPIFIFIYYISGNEVFLVAFQIIPQIIFMSGITTSVLVIFKNVGIALTFVVGYVSIEFLTMGRAMPWYHLFYFNQTVIQMQDLYVINIMNITVGIGLLFMASKIIREFK